MTSRDGTPVSWAGPARPVGGGAPLRAGAGRNAARLLAQASLALMLAACGGGGSHDAAKPAKVDPVAHETELMKITLTPEAEQRLGIAVAPVASGESRNSIATHGEIVVPPAAGGGVPITAATDLMMLAGNQAKADGDVARAAAQARIAQLNAQRADALVKEQAGSTKARDDAMAAAAVAQADLATARAQRGLLGASVSSLGRQGMLWVRVPVLAADVANVDRALAATVRSLGDGGGGIAARPVAAPPSSNAAAGSVDLYYALPNRGSLRVGQRVAVDLPATGGVVRGATVPASAILHDAYGGEWVYARTAPRVFERRRVQVASITGGSALLARGPKPGEQIVTAGAAELFGTEFGAK